MSTKWGYRAVIHQATNLGLRRQLVETLCSSTLANESETLDAARESHQTSAEEERRDRILRSAFECREELVTYARALLGNYAAAEDAVQEAMLVVVAKHDQFEEGTAVLAWCRSIVRIEVLRAKQRHQRERTLAQRVLDDAIDAAFSEFQSSRTSHERELRRDALARCIGQISDRGKRVLEARFIDELGYPQIGKRLSMSIEAVRKALFRVKKQVRECVETRLRTAQ
ncbi:RNA polymerase sigma factor [Novipirellula artificiosorum]|uniref:ECF RNA polymerase sigma factor SigR n=1 Tax=Novipirellula artificiosorum TaxID=2528016 RepID=A0A5C6DP75_9BACT|nr:sigma-70 family RNA polymerase sigma factor [Novipirellula artificiosorum]TWU38528.1 ECF RNA polymerase sigma factor SigR [Novipirellula artificiosorum]